MFNEEEIFFQCPYCFQKISILCEDLYGEQTYIEDCEICCNPIEISYKIQDQEVLLFKAKKANE